MLTDVTGEPSGPSSRGKVEKIDDFFAMEQTHGQRDAPEDMADYHDLVDSGRRELTPSSRSSERRRRL